MSGNRGATSTMSRQSRPEESDQTADRGVEETRTPDGDSAPRPMARGTECPISGVGSVLDAS